MGKREITVRCIAQTRINREEMTKWLVELGAVEFAINLPATTHEAETHLVDPPVNVANELTDAELLIGVSGKRCYQSFEVGLNPNVTKIRADWAKYIDNVLASGHGSVTEHATWTWAIEGCTRVMTAEGNRHRAGVAISEGSLRYIRFEDGIDYWEPLSIRPQPLLQGSEVLDDAGLAKMALEQKKTQTRAVFENVFRNIENNYKLLCAIWKDELAPESNFAAKKALTSMFRRIVPLGVCTGVIYTLNTRALRHVMTMRCDPAAEEEIAHVFGMIAKEMFSQEPKLFGDFVEENGFWRPRYRKV